jgi:hypothetical protein
MSSTKAFAEEATTSSSRGRRLVHISRYALREKRGYGASCYYIDLDQEDV